MKTYNLNTEKRKTLVTRIAELTGVNLRYMGAPTYAYENDCYIVARDGSLQADEREEEVIRTLLSEGLIVEAEQAETDRFAEASILETVQAEANHPVEGNEAISETISAECAPTASDLDHLIDSITISLPMEGHTPTSLRNLVNLVYSMGPLISKATGGSFRAGTKPTGEEDLSILTATLEGITFEINRIIFTGFPMTDDPDKLHAFQMLACAMNRQALGQRLIRAKEVRTESEKYTFRTWLVRIGMGGADAKKERATLLKNLSGHSAFRNKTEEEKWKARRQAEKQRA